MPREAQPRQLWECKKCGLKVIAPLPFKEVLCPSRHGARKLQNIPMAMVWSRDDGTPFPMTQTAKGHAA